MTLAFPNPSRRFDEARNAVLFFGLTGVRNTVLRGGWHARDIGNGVANS